MFSLLVLSAGFAWAAARLLELRLAAGDVYPASSSLRADPDGSRALYEALVELRGAAIRRNFEPIGRLRAGPRTTLLLLGAAPWSLGQVDRGEAEHLESVVRSGARLVIALSPIDGRLPPPEPTATPRAGKSDEKKGVRPRRPRREEADEDLEGVSFAERWGFAFDRGEPLERPAPARLAAREAATSLPATVPWRSSASFARLDPAWRAVYTLDARPVVIERPFGRGSIVLVTDSGFAANATLKAGRQPKLLVWLVGDCVEVVFDETHLGMGERSGIVALARRYRLEGLFAGLVLLALLFVWKNAVAFAPASGPPAGTVAGVTGRRAAEGLAAVLRRHVAPRDLSRNCLAEWKKAFARSRPALARQLSRAALDQDPVAAYRKASVIAKEKRLP